MEGIAFPFIAVVIGARFFFFQSDVSELMVRMTPDEIKADGLVVGTTLDVFIDPSRGGD